MDKKSLSEQDIRTKFITPAITQAGWDPMTQLREEVFFTNGRIIVRGKKKFADYVLYCRPNVPLSEQKRIVSKVTHLLSQVTRLESTLTRRESTLTQLLTAAIHELLNDA